VLPRILYIGAWSFTLARQFCVDIVGAPVKMFLAIKNLSLPVTILLAATLTLGSWSSRIEVTRAG
jgi:hypothetical protein